MSSDIENKEVRDKEFYLKNGKFYTDKNGHNNRRMEFRKYLDKTGVLDKLTGICIDLYENPLMDFPVIEYIRTNLVIPNPDLVEMEKLRKKLEEEKLFRDYIENENRDLRAIFDENNYDLPFAVEVDMQADVKFVVKDIKN